MNNDKLEAVWNLEAIEKGKEFFGKDRWNYSGECTGFLYNWIECYVLAKESSQADIEELKHKYSTCEDHKIKMRDDWQTLAKEKFDGFKERDQDIQKLALQLERAEEVLERISTSTVEVGFYIEPTWEGDLALEYFKNKEEK